MQLDGVLGDTLLSQEVLNLDPLVTLELDDFASLLIFNKGTVAGEFLSDRAKSALGRTRRSASRASGAGGGRQGERTFLNALSSFLESYSGRRKTVTIRLLTRAEVVPKRAHPWGDPAGWSVSCGHFVVGYGCGCNSAGFLRPHYQIDLLRLRKGL